MRRDSNSLATSSRRLTKIRAGFWKLVMFCLIGLQLGMKFLTSTKKTSGIINEDVVDFKPLSKYRLIVSISTLEHVGWDEEPKDPFKIIKAIDNLTSLLDEKGTLVVTLPLGQNAEMDELLKNQKLTFKKMSYTEESKCK